MARGALVACYSALLMGCQSVPLLDGEYLPGRPSPPAPRVVARSPDRATLFRPKVSS